MEEKKIEEIAALNAAKHGYKADFGAVLSKVIGEDKSSLQDMTKTKELVLRAVKKINSMSKQEIDELIKDVKITEKKEDTDLRPLPNTEKKVVLRLPPEPSGYMHLGHAIAGMINYLYKQKYNGKLWLRFEDTNPNRVKEEFFDSFRSGYSWLGIKWDEEKKVSDDMEKIYDYAEKLIRQGNAYVCECDPETIKTNRSKGIECKCRGNSLEYNLRRFEEAKEGKIAPGKAVIRLKGDMKSIDFSLRDPSLLRIIDTKYKPYKLWPLYDFASVIEDEICDVTHILRSNEFRTSLQEALRKIMGFRKPTIVQFSRYNFEGTPFSKRKIRELIEKGYIKDWNDIRLPTITAIRRRGIQPQAIYEFARRARYSSAEHVYSWDFLMTMNRRIIDPTSKRLFFVESPVRLVVTGSPTMIVKLKNHPSEDLGERTLEVDGNFFIPKRDADIMKEGSFVRLKDLYTIRIDKKYDDSIYASMFSQQKRGDEKIIQWIPQRESMEVSITKVGSLMIGNEFNPDSLSTIHGLAEINVKDLKQGEIIQFERFGFCILDDKEKASFIFITD